MLTVAAFSGNREWQMELSRDLRRKFAHHVESHVKAYGVPLRAQAGADPPRVTGMDEVAQQDRRNRAEPK